MSESKIGRTGKEKVVKLTSFLRDSVNKSERISEANKSTDENSYTTRDTTDTNEQYKNEVFDNDWSAVTDRNEPNQVSGNTINELGSEDEPRSTTALVGVRSNRTDTSEIDERFVHKKQTNGRYTSTHQRREQGKIKASDTDFKDNDIKHNEKLTVWDYDEGPNTREKYSDNKSDTNDAEQSTKAITNEWGTGVVIPKRLHDKQTSKNNKSPGLEKSLSKCTNDGPVVGADRSIIADEHLDGEDTKDLDSLQSSQDTDSVMEVWQPTGERNSNRLGNDLTNLMHRSNERKQEVESSLPPVQIKKELLDEATEMQVERTMGSEASTASSDLDTIQSGNETSSAEMSDDEMLITQGQQVDTSGTVCKRKSLQSHGNQQQKRIHIMAENSTQAHSKSVESFQDQNDGKETFDGVSSRPFDTATADPLRSVGNSPLQEDSDAEWKRIARKVREPPIKRILPDGTQGTKPIMSQPPKVQNPRQRSGVRIVTTTKSSELPDIQQRGAHMTDDKETIMTPVKIEFNLDKNGGEFNVICAVDNIFNKMATQDRSLQVYDTTSTKLLWEIGVEIIEDEQFVECFNMREQTFRNQNKKVTVYCTIVSSHNINRLKYSDPLKSFIMNNNVWIKPDFYSTKYVSSPGFFTLVHPKLTNKPDYTRDLINVLTNMEKNEDDAVVQEWMQKFRVEVATDLLVPKFHLETTVKKWGKVRVEVLSVYCSQEEAKYMKYLLSEASSQDLLTKGIYVPSGIHLMEGKEVLSNLLQEHQEYIDRVTNFQVGGISTQSMKYGAAGNESIRTMLLQCEGVSAVEPTYQTDSRGQWNIVVDKNSVRHLSDYIQKNLSSLYVNRKGQKSKLIESKQETQNPSYKLILVDQADSKVGSYAEVLKRRFPRNEESVQSLNQISSETEDTEAIPQSDNTGLQSGTKRQDKSPPTAHKNTKEGFVPSGKIIKDDRVTSILQAFETKFNERMEKSIQKHVATQKTEIHAHIVEVETSLCKKISQLDTDRIEKSLHTKVAEQNQIMQNTLMEVEDTFSSKLAKIERLTQTVHSEIESQVVINIDKIMDSKLRAVSLLVAETVTANVMQGLSAILHNKDLEGTVKTELVSQLTPDAKKTPSDPGPLIGTQTTDEQTSMTDRTKLMFDALNEIEQSHNQTYD